MTAVDHTPVAIALGGNLGDPPAQLSEAMRRLARLPQTQLRQVSPGYWTPPWGSSTPQPDYLNAVCLIDTTLTPQQLLLALQVIEHDLGRIRGDEQFGPRLIDLDIVLFGDQVIDTEDLQVPHPRMAERAFVLLPLLALAPDWMVPGFDRVEALLEALDKEAFDGIRPAHIQWALEATP